MRFSGEPLERDDACLVADVFDAYLTVRPQTLDRQFSREHQVNMVSNEAACFQAQVEIRRHAGRPDTPGERAISIVEVGENFIDPFFSLCLGPSGPRDTVGASFRRGSRPHEEIWSVNQMETRWTPVRLVVVERALHQLREVSIVYRGDAHPQSEV